MRKKILLTVAMCLSSIVALAQFSGQGSGTADDPYQITNGDELFEMRNALSACYKLMNDIDLTEWIEENNPTQGWKPVGTVTTPFHGVLNGNGHTIDGLFINRPSEDCVGLFGAFYAPWYQDLTPSVYNLIIHNPKIRGKNGTGVIAGIASVERGEDGGNSSGAKEFNIEKITIISPTVIGNDSVGSVVGVTNYGNLNNNSVVNPTISGNNSVGGIAGYYKYASGSYGLPVGSVNNCTVIEGSIVASQTVGGIVGKAVNGTTYSKNSYVVGCYISSKVKGHTAGGIVGQAEGSGYKDTWKVNEYTPYINNNHFAGKLEGTFTGGILASLYDVGYGSGLGLNKNLCSGTIYGQTSANGIVGLSVSGSTATSRYEVKDNVNASDTISVKKSNSIPYRISSDQRVADNIAMATTILVTGKETMVVSEDNNLQGTSYGKKTLMKKSTYQGLGFDFESKWAIIEGETFPYNIHQSNPPKVTSFVGGTNSVISGTEDDDAIYNVEGIVFVRVNDRLIEGEVKDGQWQVELGSVEDGTMAWVSVMVAGKMPSVATKAIAEKGSGGSSPSDPEEDIEPTDISSLTDAIYANPVTVSKGSTATLTISLKNAQTTNGYSFDLKLPEGVTLAKDNSDEYLYTLSTRHNGHVATVNYKEASGVYGFAVMSLSSKDVKESDGAILTLTLNISDEMKEGDYAVKVQNARYSLSSGATSVAMEEVTSLLTVDSYIKGDANGDSMVDIADAVCIVNHIVGKATPTFIEAAADANGDGVVDIADAVRIVNLIVGKIDALARPMTIGEVRVVEPE